MSGEVQAYNTSDHLKWKGKIKTPVGEYTYVGQNIHLNTCRKVERQNNGSSLKGALSTAGGRIELDSRNKQSLQRMQEKEAQ